MNGYTFRLDTAASTGITLNDDSISFPFVDIQTVNGLDSSEYRETIRDHEGTDGGFIDAEFEKGREIILEGVAYCTPGTEEDFLDDIKANFAPVTTPIQFHFQAPGVNERILFVKPRGVRYNWEQLRRIGMTPIQFLMYAEDPRIYDASLLTTVIPYGGSAGLGFSFNLGFNIDFGGGATPAGANVTIGGNRPAPATLTIVGPITDPLVANDTDGSVLSISGVTLTGSDSLVIDLANHTVTQNGTINRRGNLVAPNWFLFNPGTTFIRFGGTSGTGSTLTVAARSAWR